MSAVVVQRSGPTISTPDSSKPVLPVSAEVTQAASRSSQATVFLLRSRVRVVFSVVWNLSNTGLIVNVGGGCEYGQKFT